MHWTRHAHCRTENPETFAPTGAPGSPGYTRQAAQALAVCQPCPVRGDCLHDALAHGDTDTVRGGTTPADRRALRHPTRT